MRIIPHAAGTRNRPPRKKRTRRAAGFVATSNAPRLSAVRRGNRAPVYPATVANIERGKDSGNAAPVATIERAAPIPANVAGYCPPPVQPLPVRPAIAATVRASPATFGRIRRQSIENGLASRPPLRPCPRARLKRAVRFASRPRPVCNAISASRPAIRQPFDRGATYPATVCQLPPSNAATYPATSNAANVRRPSAFRRGDRGEHRTPRRIRRHRVPVYPASRGEHRTRQTCATVRAGFRPMSAATVRRLSAIPASVRASLSGKPQPFDRAPPVSRSTVANIERRAGFVATVRQSIRQAVAVRRAPPVSGSTVRAGFVATVRRLSAVRRGDRGEHGTRQPCATVPACQSIRQAVAVRPCAGFVGNLSATIERAAPIPANVAGYCPPSVQPLPVRLAIAATIRASPATFGRIRRQSIENGLASRPPLRPCPRPSETRRALCKPSAPRLQRNQRKPSGNPATVRPWRNLSGDRVPVATIERRNLSGNIKRGECAPPVSRSTVANIERRAGFVATVCQSIRQAVANIERRAGFRRDRAPVYPASRNRSTVRRLSAVRPSAPDSGQYQRQPWRPFDRGEHRTPRHHRTRQGFRQRRASCHHRTRRACQPFDVATVRQSIRQAVANIERGNLSGDRAPVRAGTPQPFAACQRFDVATVANMERGNRAQPFRPVSLSGKPWRPCAGFVGNLSATIERAAPDSGQCRRIPPAARSTVARPPCNRGNRSRQSRDVWPLSRRKRPCKPSAVPPMSAPV